MTINEAIQQLITLVRQDERASILSRLNATPPAIEWARSVVASGTATKGAHDKERRAKGAKRSPEALRAQTNSLMGAIRTAPGSSIEYLGKQLSTPTKDLVLPVRKLLAAKKIRTVGRKRATKYFPKGR